MPNILKRFSEFAAYNFQDAEELVVGEEPLEQPEQASEFDETDDESAPRRRTEQKKAPTARTNIDYAKLQAEAIMERARQDADEYLERAKQEAQSELDMIREGARDEGYRQGYAEGIARALDESKVQEQRRAAELSGDVAEFLERAAAAREEMLIQTQDELKELALTIAEKVVRVSLRSSGEIISRIIQGATEKMTKKEWVHIYIADCDAKRMAQTVPGFAKSLAPVSDHVRIFPMGDDESGSCIIEMPDQIIDASVSTQMSNIRDLLHNPRPRDF